MTTPEITRYNFFGQIVGTNYVHDTLAAWILAGCKSEQQIWEQELYRRLKEYRMFLKNAKTNPYIDPYNIDVYHRVIDFTTSVLRDRGCILKNIIPVFSDELEETNLRFPKEDNIKRVKDSKEHAEIYESILARHRAMYDKPRPPHPKPYPHIENMHRIDAIQALTPCS
jgi:hypothetical protein